MLRVIDCVICCIREGTSALHLGAEQSREDIADTFANAKLKLGLIPLHLSTQTGSPHLIQLLTKTHQACTHTLSLVRAHLFTQL